MHSPVRLSAFARVPSKSQERTGVGTSSQGGNYAQQTATPLLCSALLGSAPLPAPCSPLPAPRSLLRAPCFPLPAPRSLLSAPCSRCAALCALRSARSAMPSALSALSAPPCCALLPPAAICSALLFCKCLIPAKPRWHIRVERWILFPLERAKAPVLARCSNNDHHHHYQNNNNNHNNSNDNNQNNNNK